MGKKNAHFNSFEIKIVFKIKTHVLWVQVAVKGPEVVVRWSNSFRKPQPSHLANIRSGGLCVTDDHLHPHHAVIRQLCSGENDLNFSL